MKIFKNRLFIFILGGIFFSSIAVFAVTTISADQIDYDENTTVKDKIDDLYIEANKYSVFQELITVKSGNKVSIGGISNFYKKFMITVLWKTNSETNCTIQGENTNTWAYENIYSFNQQYDINSLYKIYLTAQNGQCDLKIQLYK